MRNYQTLTELTEEYFVHHPEEIDDFLKECFVEYAQDGNGEILLSQLRLIARVKGLGASDEEFHKVRSVRDSLGFDRINAIMQVMGYQLIPQRIDQAA